MERILTGDLIINLQLGKSWSAVMPQDFVPQVLVLFSDRFDAALSIVLVHLG